MKPRKPKRKAREWFMWFQPGRETAAIWTRNKLKRANLNTDGGILVREVLRSDGKGR